MAEAEREGVPKTMAQHRTATAPSKLGLDGPAPSQSLRSPSIRSSALIWLAFFLLYLGLGLYLSLHLHYYAGDAASRVGNAYYVLFSRDPHLGAIGFIWNPLPSVLELPFVAMYPLVPSMVTHALAGAIVSSGLAAWGILSLGRILDNFGIRPQWKYAVMIGYSLNPLIMLYSANGMSDIMLISCVLGTYSGLFDFIQYGSLFRLASAGFWMAAALGMRYEAVPFAALVIVGFAAGQWGKVKPAVWKGAAIILGAPIVVSGGLWLYFNWLIMKNPFYFVLSNYGNVAQTNTGSYVTRATTLADHHIIGSLWYIIHFTLLFWPIIPAIFLAGLFSFGRHRDPRAPVLVSGTFGLVSMELAGVYLGHLGQWDRYFISYIPNGILLLCFVAMKLTQGRPPFMKTFIWLLAVIIVLAGNAGTILALQNPALGHPDGEVIDRAWRGQSMRRISDPYAKDLSVIQYINNHPKMIVLADTFEDWPIVVRVHNPRQFIITSDYNFNSVLNNPKGLATAILVPDPVGVAKLDAVNTQWPTLWAGEVPWAKLIKSFPGGNRYRLYDVTPNAP